MGTPLGRPTSSVNFKEPEACPFLKYVLRASLFGSSQERLLALKELGTALPDPLQLLGRVDHAVGAAIFLLENGFLPVVVSGLEEAAQGDWVVVLEASTTGRPDEAVNKAVLYTCLLKRLVHDTRTIKFILQNAPGLLETLSKMYRIDSIRIPDGMGGLPEMVVYDSGLKILGVLTLILVWSEQARRKIARLDGFLSRLLRRILESLGDRNRQDYVIRAFAVFQHVPPLAPTGTFEKIAGDCLNVVTRVLSRSSSRYEIEYAIKFMGRIAAAQFVTYRSQFCNEPLLVDSAKALVACANADTFARHLGRAIVWTNLQAKGGVFIEVEEYERVVVGGLTEQQELLVQEEARQSTTALERSKVLSQIYATQRKEICLGHAFAPLSQQTQEPSIPCSCSPKGDPIHPEPPRKCSKVGCKQFETSSREYKMCSQCKLTAYCSKECQKEAWKLGHKDMCQKPGA